MKSFINKVLPPVLWAVIIFYLSHQPNLGTGLGMWDLMLRKAAHMFVFAVLFWLVWRGASYNKKFFVTAFAIAVLYAISDEWHQTFIVGREGSGWDILIDTVGILAATVFLRRKKI